MFCFGTAVAAAVLSVIAANTDGDRGCGCRGNGRVAGERYNRRGNRGCGCGCGGNGVDDAFDHDHGCGCGRG